jgi:hypothetical protein
LGPQIANKQITKRIGSANRHICGSSANLTARFVLSEILCTAEKPADTQNSLPGQLANWSERLTTIIENVSSNPLHGHELSARITQNIYLWGTPILVTPT